jgi:hypothetical protein
MCGAFSKNDAPKTTSPAEAGLRARGNRLLLAARQAEAGEAYPEQRERGGLGNGHAIVR